MYLSLVFCSGRLNNCNFQTHVYNTKISKPTIRYQSIPFDNKTSHNGWECSRHKIRHQCQDIFYDLCVCVVLGISCTFITFVLSAFKGVLPHESCCAHGSRAGLRSSCSHPFSRCGCIPCFPPSATTCMYVCGYCSLCLPNRNDILE